MRRRISGFTVLEMVVVTGLFVMAAEIAVPILRWSIIDVHNAQTDADSADCLDRATNALRKDIWQAREMHTSTSDRLTLTSAAGHEITWQANADGSLERSESSASNQQWTTFLAGISFAQDGSVLVVTIPGSPQHPGSTISMISPAMLYSGEQR
jgi:type II secretory pathway component PulJ